MVSTSCIRVGEESHGWVGLVLCTLLGPEGPGIFCITVVVPLLFGESRVSVPLGRWPDFSGCGLWTFASDLLMGCGGGYRPYFENYTVDASILDTRIKFIGFS